MMRERLNAVDVAVVVCNLQKSIVDYNLVNIYDVNSRVYILKFSRNEDKKFVLFEIGNRIHKTQFLRGNDRLPSNFNAKLRKHLRTRKLRDIRQVAQDRVVDFTFSSGEYAYHLIVQFFLPGNIYLTDYKYTVLAALRHHNAGGISFKVGSVYEIPETFVPWNVPLSAADIDKAVKQLKEPAQNGQDGSEQLPTAPTKGGKGSKNSKEAENSKGSAKEGKKATKKKGGKEPQQDKPSDLEQPPQTETIEGGEVEEGEINTVRSLIKTIFPSVHKTMVDYVINHVAGKPDSLMKNLDDVSGEELLNLAEAVRKFVESLAYSTTLVPGFLFKNGTEYADFSPFEMKDDAERFDDFNDALDTYFTKSDMKKIEKQEQPKKPIKLKKIKDDQDRREQKLENEINRLSVDIEFIEIHQTVFDSALDLLRSLVATGASWREIMDQLAIQREAGHPLVQRIRSVNIPDRRVELCLPSDDPEFYKSGMDLANKKGKKKNKKDEEPVTDIGDVKSAVLDYGLTCFKNLEIMYSNKKRLTEKLDRTRIGREFALKRVDEQKEKSKKKGGGKHAPILKVRKRMWFEKFHWFITSDGYLVLGGRDATQNELLVKRYLTRGDLYFHAEIHGAASCILKNPANTTDVPNRSIEEAACFAVCLSNAWTNKMMIPAWWVHHDQVSRSAPSGEYLPHGSFMIRGKKNFVTAQRLEMAIGVVFHVDIPQLEGEDLPDEDAPPEEETDEPPELEPDPEHEEEDDDEQEDDVTPEEDEDEEDLSKDVSSYSEDDTSVDDEEDECEDKEPTDEDASDEDEEEEEEEEEPEKGGVHFADEEDEKPGVSFAEEDDEKPGVRFADEEKKPGVRFAEEEEPKKGGVRFADEDDDEKPGVRFAEEEREPMVRFDTTNKTVHDVIVDHAGLKSALGRRPTRFVSEGFDPSELMKKLSTLGLVDANAAHDVKVDSVCFVKPEGVSHSPEAIRKLRQRLPTGFPGKKKGGLSRAAAIKAARAQMKYGEDDEETQELRKKLTGSKDLKHVEERKAVAEEVDTVGKAVKRAPLVKQDIKPLDDKELENHMRQFSHLSKNPGPDDVIISAIPMCAPYSALKEHPYHMKLLPGHTKKGAIATLAMQRFLKVDPTKEQYIKLITVDQFSLALIEDCKVHAVTNEQKRT